MQVIDYMNKDGYFKSKREYEKCFRWAREGIIPSFMHEDYEKYKQRLKNERRRINT